MDTLESSQVAQPLFIVGTPRSGTTLLAKILGRHPEIFMSGETHYFMDIYARQAEIGDLSDTASRNRLWDRLTDLYARYNEPEDQSRIDLLLQDDATSGKLRQSLHGYDSAFRCFMNLQTEYEGKRRWGNNAPKDLFYVDEIRKVFPGAKFLVCSRDIRDFLGSYKNKWKVTSHEQVKRLQKLYHPVVTSFLWKASMNLVPSLQHRLGGENVKIVSYERLVSESEKTLREVCQFLGETFYEDMLDVRFNNSSDVTRTRGISSTSMGRWKERLTNEEIWIAQRIGGNEMVKLGYEKEDVRVKPVRLLLLLCSTPIALWHALQANKRNTGPILPYLVKRIRALFLSR